MSYGNTTLAGGLHLVATPIGNARDITLRALDTLAAADVLAAEDTRSLRRLLDIHGIPIGGRPLISYHDHNGRARRPRLLRLLAEGKSVVYAAEAGTPLVADPGFALVRAALEAGAPVQAEPGASAALTALSVSGLASDRFLFAGFLSNTAKPRRAALAELAGVPATLVFYESPRRVHEMLTDSGEVLGHDRRAAVCRELTKRFEETERGTLEELAARFADRPVKGELVVLIDRIRRATPERGDVAAALRAARSRCSVRDAVAEVAAAYDLPRREIYAMALELERGA